MYTYDTKNCFHNVTIACIYHENSIEFAYISLNKHMSGMYYVRQLGAVIFSDLTRPDKNSEWVWVSEKKYGIDLVWVRIIVCPTPNLTSYLWYIKPNTKP